MMEIKVSFFWKSKFVMNKYPRGTIHGFLHVKNVIIENALFPVDVMKSKPKQLCSPIPPISA